MLKDQRGILPKVEGGLCCVTRDVWPETFACKRRYQTIVAAPCVYCVLLPACKRGRLAAEWQKGHCCMVWGAKRGVREWKPSACVELLPNALPLIVLAFWLGEKCGAVAEAWNNPNLLRVVPSVCCLGEKCGAVAAAKPSARCCPEAVCWREKSQKNEEEPWRAKPTDCVSAVRVVTCCQSTTEKKPLSQLWRVQAFWVENLCDLLNLRDQKKRIEHCFQKVKKVEVKCMVKLAAVQVVCGSR